MNRRTFLKLTSTAVAVVAIPAIAKTPKPRWIPFTESTPQTGQKVIIVGSPSIKGDCYLRGGTILDRSRSAKEDPADIFTTLPMRRDFSRRLHNGQDAWVYAAYSKEGEGLIKTRDWMEYNKKPSRITNYFWPGGGYVENEYHQNIGMSFRKDCHHWLPVNGEYPKTIPTVPTYDSKLVWYPVPGGSVSFTVAERINFAK